MKNRLLLLAVIGTIVANGCMTEPPVTAVPKGTGCASLAIACFDEFARQPAKIICFREQSRWDQTELTWRVGSFFDNLDQAGQIDAADRAMQLWADASGLTFTQVTTGSADITLDFVAGEHGDEFPFDGPGDILGHAFFPGSGSPGQIHLCDQEQWAFSAGDGQFDLFTGLVHEIGHSLGLEHSLTDGAIMAPSYMDGITELTQDDIDAIQRLYGSPDGDVPAIVEQSPEFMTFCADAGMNLTALDDPDTDDDGIPDTIERFVLNTDPVGSDTDNDGANDFTEIFIDRTDPLDIRDFIPSLTNNPDGSLSIDVFIDGVLRTQYRTGDPQTSIDSTTAVNDLEYFLSANRFNMNGGTTIFDSVGIGFANRDELTGQPRDVRDIQLTFLISEDSQSTAGPSDGALWSNICPDSSAGDFFCSTLLFEGVSGTINLGLLNGRLTGSFDVSGPGTRGGIIRVVGNVDIPEQFTVLPDIPLGLSSTIP